MEDVPISPSTDASLLSPAVVSLFSATQTIPSVAQPEGVFPSERGITSSGVLLLSSLLLHCFEAKAAYCDDDEDDDGDDGSGGVGEAGDLGASTSLVTSSTLFSTPELEADCCLLSVPSTSAPLDWTAVKLSDIFWCCANRLRLLFRSERLLFMAPGLAFNAPGFTCTLASDVRLDLTKCTISLISRQIRVLSPRDFRTYCHVSNSSFREQISRSEAKQRKVIFLLFTKQK